LQTSIYLNISNASFEENGSIINEQSLGFSNEWIYRLLDRDEDPLGIALYAEPGISATEIELEGKIILDKKIDKFLFAFNAVGEHSFITGIGSDGIAATQPEDIIEFDAGAAYFLTKGFTIGFEAHSHTKKLPSFEGGGSFSAFFAGPAFAVSGDEWWIALSIMPQLGGNSTGSGIKSTDRYELVEHEKLEARLLFSIGIPHGSKEESEEKK
jgi:Family of unknown function (DUF6662)